MEMLKIEPTKCYVKLHAEVSDTTLLNVTIIERECQFEERLRILDIAVH
jgi:hypothetical protein